MNSRQPWVTQGPDTKRKKKKPQDLGTAKGGVKGAEVWASL